MNIGDWKKNGSQLGQYAAVPDKYSFPRDVASCAVQDVWVVPADCFAQGITTNEVLPELTRIEIQRLTGTLLLASCNKRTVYIGASQIKELNPAKKKLHVLARFLVSSYSLELLTYRC